MMLRRTTRRQLVVSLFIAVMLAVVGIVPAAGAATPDSFGVSPLRIDVDTAAGKVTSHEITITNSSAAAQSYTFTKEDFAGDAKDPRGTPHLLGGKVESKISGYDWLTRLPEQVTIPAGQSKVITVRVSVPAGSVGGHYAALLVNSKRATGGALTAHSRIAVLFVMNAGGVAPPELVVNDIERLEDGAVRVIYENVGSTNDQPTATFTPTSPVIGNRPTGGTTTSTTCTESLPGGLGECTFPKGTAGSSEGLVGTTAGAIGSGGKIELKNEDGITYSGAMASTWMGSLGSLLLPIVGITGIVIYFMLLRRHRDDEDEDDGGAQPAY